MNSFIIPQFLNISYYNINYKYSIKNPDEFPSFLIFKEVKINSQFIKLKNLLLFYQNSIYSQQNGILSVAYHADKLDYLI